MQPPVPDCDVGRAIALPRRLLAPALRAGMFALIRGRGRSLRRPVRILSSFIHPVGHDEQCFSSMLLDGGEGDAKSFGDLQEAVAFDPVEHEYLSATWTQAIQSALHTK